MAEFFCLVLRTIYEIFGHLAEFGQAAQAVPPPERVLTFLLLSFFLLSVSWFLDLNTMVYIIWADKNVLHLLQRIELYLPYSDSFHLTVVVRGGLECVILF